MSGSAEHRIWKGMIRRGLGKQDRELYFDRGIRVCLGLQAFDVFFALLGSRPTSSHSVDRKDNDGGYWCGACAECAGAGHPPNIQWATPEQQRANQRPGPLVTFRGVSKTITEWAASLGITQAAMSDRLKRWSLERALTTPRREQKSSRQPPKDANAAANR